MSESDSQKQLNWIKMNVIAYLFSVADPAPNFRGGAFFIWGGITSIFGQFLTKMRYF